MRSALQKSTRVLTTSSRSLLPPRNRRVVVPRRSLLTAQPSSSPSSSSFSSSSSSSLAPTFKRLLASRVSLLRRRNISSARVLAEKQRTSPTGRTASAASLVERSDSASKRARSLMTDTNSQGIIDVLPEDAEGHNYDYDLIVLGGGSGGMALSKEAAELGQKVAVLDFVKPTPQGTQWGLGGTCVNVGCIPKKLFHLSSLEGDRIEEGHKFGWKTAAGRPEHDWEQLRDTIQDHIGSLNWGHRVDLRTRKVKYLNAYGVFKDHHTISATDRKGKVTELSARRIVICVGGRPIYPDIPGAKEYGITSDDVFQLDKPPGKTLVVGASYVALECAGFIRGLGYETTVMVRSIFLRGFDQQMATLVGEHMEEAAGVQFIKHATPQKIEKLESGKLKVTYNGEAGEHSAEFDTVLFAIGRRVTTDQIDIEKTGIEIDSRNGKLTVDEYERTSVPHIYAIGDVLQGRLELTPVAIQAGRLLAHRLYNGKTRKMDYVNVPTAVFTPLEYSFVGLSEEDAIAQHGEDNIEVYHSFMKPYEWIIPGGENNRCYCKMICLKNEDERVIGLHLFSPNAGEIIQGLAVSLKLGVTKAHFDETVGIHPTLAEDFTGLTVTKRSGESAEKKSC